VVERRQPRDLLEAAAAVERARGRVVRRHVQEDGAAGRGGAGARGLRPRRPPVRPPARAFPLGARAAPACSLQRARSQPPCKSCCLIFTRMPEALFQHPASPRSADPGWADHGDTPTPRRAGARRHGHTQMAAARTQDLPHALTHAGRGAPPRAPAARRPHPLSGMAPERPASECTPRAGCARARRRRRHSLRRVRRRGVRRVQSGRPVRAAPACEPCAGCARCACAAWGPPGGGTEHAQAALASCRVPAADGAQPAARTVSSAPWGSAVELHERPTSAVRPAGMTAMHGRLQDRPRKLLPTLPRARPPRRKGPGVCGLAAGARQAPARLSSRRLLRPSSARSCASHSRRATSRSVMKPASSPSPPSLLRRGASCCGGAPTRAPRRRRARGTGRPAVGPAGARASARTCGRPRRSARHRCGRRSSRRRPRSRSARQAPSSGTMPLMRYCVQPHPAYRQASKRTVLAGTDVRTGNRSSCARRSSV